MTWTHMLGLGLSIGLLVYLFAALLKPEAFE
jgi:K+-transporting ATPase KdpF subunit